MIFPVSAKLQKNEQKGKDRKILEPYQRAEKTIDHEGDADTN